MTSHSDPTGYLPADDAPLGWDWLQSRISDTDVAILDLWLDEQLELLETQFEGFVTPRSLAKELRSGRAGTAFDE